MNNNLKKIAIIGAESTGKSNLCKALALHFDCEYCPEYARTYLLTHGKDYVFADLEKIARGQMALEDAYCGTSMQKNKKYLFLDTEMYIMKVWYEFAYHRCPYFILEEITNRNYDLYLFTNIDLPWEADELREYPDLGARQQLFHTYRDILINQRTPWGMVSGQGTERIQNAIDIIEEMGY